jgi:internalin A
MTEKDRYEIAVKLIDDAFKNNSEVLDLGGLNLLSIPPEIATLTNLKSLIVSHNQLTSLPEEIGSLKNLTSLLANHNRVQSIPASIGNLTNIQRLDISHNKLEVIPAELGHLEKLEFLYLKENSIRVLPKELGNLKSITVLDLDGNHLTSIPREIAQLSNLKTLDLYGNRITTFPFAITAITSLEKLYFGNNKLKEIPEKISRLINLQELLLSGNLITTSPQTLNELKKLKTLNLRGNPLNIPPEILETINEPQAIINFIDAVQMVGYLQSINANKKVKRLNETKVLIIGQGGIGKTSLIQRILHDTFDQNQSKTEGISINPWQINKSSLVFETANVDMSIKLNIWDFGGQEIMHATHQFFLTKRSLYLLVLDARLTQEENRVEYWLKIIQSFGGESPVLIVGNKTDQHPLDIDRTGLQKKYPNIVGILETSAATGMGIEALKAEITKQVDTLPHVRDLLPETWFTVKSKLEELGRDKNFITQDEYLGLCGANDVTDETSQHTLIGFLHDLGVVLHFQDDPRLEALGILNPQWVTNGVYKILNSHELFQSQGILNPRLLNEILNSPEYPRDRRLFIIDMMKKFELCYDIVTDKSFLIPDLLPKDEPFTGEWDGALAFQYHYNVLPTSIISRFIVRMNAFVHKTVWRSGVVLKSGENTALVKADTEDRKIYIWVNGDENTRRDFLSAIRMEFDAIHKTIAKIEATEKVPLPNYPNADPVDYRLLLQLEQKGILTHHVQADAELVEVTVRELLDGVRPSKNQALKVFISYGHDDKAFVKKLAGDLGKDSIEAWWDFDALKGGHDWQKEIQQGIKRCDYFIVVLSPNSVDRDWVLKEITFANEYKKKIIPLMLKECERPISVIEKQYIDFEKQTQKVAINELLGILKP